MSAFTDRPNSALVVIDVQNDVVSRAHRRDEVVANIAALVDRARAAWTPVVWVQHSDDEMPVGSDAWQYVSELTMRDDEPVVHKSFGDSFEGTDLDDVLSRLRVGRLIVVGAQTDMCIRSTLHGAITRGYDAQLVDDAHTTNDSEWDGVETPAATIIAHTNMYWHWHRTPVAVGGTTSTADARF